jgi:hypothetical protein
VTDETFLTRWSRRKRAALEGRLREQPAIAPAPEASSPAAPAASAPAAAESALATPAPLPPIESLSVESDFTPFMARDVDPALKRAALRKLFEDERFNVMDGLDVYIDDYTKPAPIPPEWYAQMAQMAHLGDAAPRTEPLPEAAEPAPAAAPAPAAHDPEAPAALPASPIAEADGGQEISQYDISAEDASRAPPKGASG